MTGVPPTLSISSSSMSSSPHSFSPTSTSSPSLQGRYGAQLQRWLQGREPIRLPANSRDADQVLRRELCRLGGFGQALGFPSQLLSRRQPTEFGGLFTDFWSSILWELLVDTPHPAFLKSLDLIQRDLLLHLRQPFPHLTQFGWDVVTAVTIGNTLCRLRSGLLGSRRQSWWCLRAIRALPLDLQKALVRKGPADILHTVDIVELIRLQTCGMFGDSKSIRGCACVYLPAWRSQSLYMSGITTACPRGDARYLTPTTRACTSLDSSRGWQVEFGRPTKQTISHATTI